MLFKGIAGKEQGIDVQVYRELNFKIAYLYQTESLQI